MDRIKYVLKLRKDLVDKASESVSNGDFDSFTSYVELAIQKQLESTDEDNHTDAIDIDLEIKKMRSFTLDAGPDTVIPSNSSFEISQREILSIVKCSDYDLQNPAMTKIIDKIKGMFFKRDFSFSASEDGFKKIKVGNKESLLAWNFNRYFPIKVMLRLIIYLSDKQSIQGINPGGLILDSGGRFLPKHLDSISIAGAPFKVSDDLLKRKRGEAFSTGFPIYKFKGGENNKLSDSQKAHKHSISTDRFIKIFALKYRGSKNEVYGALAKLGFINLYRDIPSKDMIIKVTEKGLKFNNIDNPVIDSDQLNNHKISPLSKDEIRFLIDHLRKNLPLDFTAMSALIQLINKGCNTQDKLKQQIMKDKGWTEIRKTIEDQYAKSGLGVDLSRVKKRVLDHMNTIISRSAELGFIDKEKQALSVTYVITESGKKLIKGE